MDYLKSIIFSEHFLKREYLGIILTLLLFFLFPLLIRNVDATAAAIDPGALSAILMAVLAMLIFKLSTWWLIKTIWPLFATYSEYHFETNFKSLQSWQKVIIFLGFYWLLLFGFLLALQAVL